jgi:hypothetical protein
MNKMEEEQMQEQTFQRADTDAQSNTDKIINLAGKPKVPWLIRYNISEALSDDEPTLDFVAINVGYFVVGYGTLDKKLALTDPRYHLKLKFTSCRYSASEYFKMVETTHMSNISHVVSNRIREVMDSFSPDNYPKIINNYEEYMFLKRISSLLCVLAPEPHDGCDVITPEDSEKIKNTYKHLIIKIPFFFKKILSEEKKPDPKLDSLITDILSFQKSVNEDQEKVQSVLDNIKSSQLYLNDFVNMAYNSLPSSFLYPEHLVERVVDFIQSKSGSIDTRSIDKHVQEYESKLTLESTEYSKMFDKDPQKDEKIKKLDTFSRVITKAVNTGNILNVEHEPSKSCDNRYDFNSDFECKIKKTIKDTRVVYLSEEMKKLQEKHNTLKTLQDVITTSKFDKKEKKMKEKYKLLKSLQDDYNPKKREQYRICKTREECKHIDLSKDPYDECYILWNKGTGDYKEDVDIL